MKEDFEQFKLQFQVLPLGLSINNLGCIRFDSNNNWNGQVGNYHGFVRFDKIENGIRAMTFILMKYIYKYRLFDVRIILERYAPANDGNSPNIYARIVSQHAGIYFIPNKIAQLREVLPVLIYRMTCVENGKDYYIKSLQSKFFIDTFISCVQMYIDEYLNEVVYPVHGKKETI